jgi:hypothetical protein
MTSAGIPVYDLFTGLEWGSTSAAAIGRIGVKNHQKGKYA